MQIVIAFHVQTAREISRALQTGTVGASSFVTRRVLSENEDVIYDKSVMFWAIK